MRAAWLGVDGPAVSSKWAALCAAVEVQDSSPLACTARVASTGVCLVSVDGEVGAALSAESSLLGLGVVVGGCPAARETGADMNVDASRPYALPLVLNPGSNLLCFMMRVSPSGRVPDLLASVSSDDTGDVVLRTEGGEGWTLREVSASQTLTLVAHGSSSAHRGGKMPLCVAPDQEQDPCPDTNPSVLRDGTCSSFSDAFAGSTRACRLPQCSSPTALPSGEWEMRCVLLVRVRKHVNNLNGARASVIIEDGLGQVVAKAPVLRQRCDTERMHALTVPWHRQQEDLFAFAAGESGFAVSQPVVEVSILRV